MSVRLSLVSAPIGLEERYGRFSGAGSTLPSFGLVCLAGVAREAGAVVQVVEAAAENLSGRQTLDRVLEFKPDIVGISSTTAGIVAAGELAEAVKQAGSEKRTVIGGCHASALPAETLRQFPAFDAAVVGEGERTLVDILGRVAGGENDFSGIPGTATRIEGQPVLARPRELIEELDELPFPAWDLIRGFPGAFRASPARARRFPCASVVLTRGCPNRCTFCDRSVFGNRCRGYSPDRAVRLIKHLRERYGVKEVLIEDDTFVVSARRVREFCEKIISEKVDVTWSCLGRADAVTLDLLKLMRRAGCWQISYGVESGDPEILRAANKNLDIGEIRQAVGWSREAGMVTKGFFMVGFPGETDESLAASVRLACSLPLDDITVMHLTPFPGSELFKNADKFGSFERDWRKMNALDTVFVPRGLTKERLERAGSAMFRSFYLRPSVIMRHACRLASNPRLAGAMLKGVAALFRSAA